MGSQASSAGFHFFQDYDRCKRYWFNKYVRELEPKDQPPATIFGECGHAALELYYTDVMNRIPFHERPARMRTRFLEELEGHRELYQYQDRWEEDMQRAKTICDIYCLHYANENLRPEVVEAPLEVELSNGQIFTGRTDMVTQTLEGQRYIMDHKFTGWSLNNFAKSVKASDQATAYLYLWNSMHPETPAVGVIFNIIREYKGTVNFLRPIVTKTRGDLHDFELDLLDKQNEILTRLGDSEARWPKNTLSCFLFNRPCPFIEICQGENFQGVLKHKFTEGAGADSKE